MKKTDAIAALPSLYSEYLRETGNENTPADKLDGEVFAYWLGRTHPEYLNFRSVQPPHDVVEMWFAETHDQRSRY